MGTRGLIHIKEDNKTITTIYRQYDCYPTGLGQDLINILKNSQIVNGYSGGMANPTHFNGIGCLAAHLIKELKDSIGNVYLYPPNSKNCGEEYVYTLSVNDLNEIIIKVKDVYSNKVLYNGPISNYNPKDSE